MRETRPSGSEGGEAETNRLSLPLFRRHSRRTAGQQKDMSGKALEVAPKISQLFAYAEVHFKGQSGILSDKRSA